MATIIGTNNSERLDGTTVADTIEGKGGADTLFGHDGDDVLFGSGLVGNPATDGDTLFGGNGNDRLNGGMGTDTLLGEAGNDVLVASNGFDRMDGGLGNDLVSYENAGVGVTIDLNRSTITFGAETHTIVSIESAKGSQGGDNITGTSGDNHLDGHLGNDVLVAGNGADTLLGGLGNDILDAGFGRDILDGGDGIDTAIYTSLNEDPGVPFFQNLETGQAGVVGAVPLDTIRNVENLIGTNFKDITTGNGVANHIQAFNGDDEVDGRGGNDTLVGGGGGDTLKGSDGADLLVGDTGNDLLLGGNGNDTLEGGPGRDVLGGGANADRFVFRAGSIFGPDSGVGAGNRDVVFDFQKGSDKIDLSPIRAAPTSDDFTFIGTSGFTAEGQVRFFQSNGVTVVQLNTAGSSGADMEIELTGLHNLAAADFVL